MNICVNHNLNNPYFNSKLIDIQKILLKEKMELEESGNKAGADARKEMITAYTGMLGEENSPFYCPEHSLAMRINGQLYMSLLIDFYWKNDIEIVFVNTDSLIILVPRDKIPLLSQAKIEMSKYNLMLVNAMYSRIYFTTSNNYIAETIDGKIKLKGFYDYNTNVDENIDFPIIPMAIEACLINGVPVADTINSCNELIKFCSLNETEIGYMTYYDSKKIDNINRIFVAKPNKGFYLYKTSDGKNMSKVMKDTPLIICNDDITKADVKSFPIDKSWYINKVVARIDKLFPRQTSLF